MATSGVSTWELVEREIIEESMQTLGVLAEDEHATPEQLTSARRTLNMILKAWQQSHVFLHTREWINVTLAQNAEYFTPEADTINIEEAHIRDGGNDYPIEIKSFEDYAGILDKTDTGRPFMIVFDRQLVPRVYLYYRPDRADYILRYLKIRKLEDVTAPTQTVDLTPESMHAIVMALSYKLSWKYGKKATDKQMLREDTKGAWRTLQSWNRERTDGDFIKGAY